ncbi:MAG: hypothetical protein ACHQ1G_04295 [Planctomycetota bacterium]
MHPACPQCGHELPRARWQPRLTCPQCGLRFGNPAYDLPPAAEQVRRDRSGLNGALIGLAGLGVTGVFSLGAIWPAYLLVALLGVFGISIWCSDKPGARHPVVATILGLFATAGVVILLGGAVVIYLFLQCATGGLKFG